MTSLWKFLSVAGSLALLGAAAALITARSANGAPPPHSVVVVNTGAHPVPTAATGTTTVDGSVRISGTVGVSATQSGDWNVGIVGTVPVQQADTAALQAYQASGTVTLAAGINNFIAAGPLVPTGKRFVIEYVSAEGLLPTGAKLLRAGVSTKLNGIYGDFHALVPIFTGSGATEDFFAMSHPMRLYADPGTTLHMLVVRNQTGIGTAAQVDFKFSGYLVP